jgi:hypothetical protein
MAIFEVFAGSTVVAALTKEFLYCSDECTVVRSCRVLLRARSRITRLLSSEKFQLLVVGAIDGHVQMCSLRTDHLLKSVFVG